jgi:transposase-like protein
MTDGERLDHLTLVMQASKEEMADEIIRLRREVRELKERLEKEAAKEAERKSHQQRKPIKARWKKLGAPVGHHGATRRKPEHIDKTIDQYLDSCPDCGCKDMSAAPSANREHIQEDIIPARVEVTKFIHHAHWCPCCGEVKIAGYAPEEVPKGYLGPNVLILTIRMKYHQGLSYEKIRQFLEGFCGLKVTESALAQALQRIARWLEVEESIVLAAIRASPYVHVDETGWKIAGRGHWLWDFVNQLAALYRIRRSRGKIVPEEVLTKDYQGNVISDFWAAYNKIGKLRQRCLVHLKREMRRIKDLDTSEQSQKAYQCLNRIINDAKRLNDKRKELDTQVFIHRLRLLEHRLFEFATGTFEGKHWQRISARMLKYYREMLTFLKVNGLPSDNNHAERMIRPNVIFRKISFENMSEKGARAHEVLMSLLQTLRLQKMEPSTFFKRAYLAHRQGRPAPLLSLITA